MSFFIVFLDIDGVMHRGTTGTFRHMPLLEELVRSHSDIRIVVSSSWKQMHTLAELQQWFSSSVAQRLIDVTPTLTPIQAVPSRQREIEAWLSQHAITHFCAIDDDAKLFQPDWPHLVLTEGTVGMTSATIEEVTKRVHYFSAK